MATCENKRGAEKEDENDANHAPEIERGRNVGVNGWQVPAVSQWLPHKQEEEERRVN